MEEEVEVLKNKLDKLEREEFMLQMCDHWDYKDYETDRRLFDQIREIKHTLKEKYGIEVE